MKAKTFLTATVLSLPLLTACSAGQNETQPTNAATMASSSTSPAAQTAQNSGTAQPTQTADSAAPTDPASTSVPTTSANPTALPAVADPCAGACKAAEPIAVEHPKFGPMEIVAYGREVKPGGAPSSVEPSYALYQNGTPVGYVAAKGAAVVNFGTAPLLPGQSWELGTGSNVDRHGNVFLSYEDGVTVLTPTDNGYDSQGTMPQPDREKSLFKDSGLRIDANGDATITQKKMGSDGTLNGGTVTYTWDGSKFAPKS